ncbi:hypothetical protein [Serratia marcescens]|nr:hypothetical protein [Serratia marcescens]
MIDKLLQALKADRIDMSTLASMLAIPIDELANLLFKVAVIVGGGSTSNSKRPDLKLV